MEKVRVAEKQKTVSAGGKKDHTYYKDVRGEHPILVTGSRSFCTLPLVMCIFMLSGVTKRLTKRKQATMSIISRDCYSTACEK